MESLRGKSENRGVGIGVQTEMISFRSSLATKLKSLIPHLSTKIRQGEPLCFGKKEQLSWVCHAREIHLNVHAYPVRPNLPQFHKFSLQFFFYATGSE